MAGNAVKLEYVTPVGRFVGGDPFKPNTTDMQGQQLKVKNGPNAGNDTQQYVMVLAVPKMVQSPQTGQMAPNAEWAAFYQRYASFAAQQWPQLFNPQTGQFNGTFAMKLQDGDGPDGNGKPNATKEGYAGNWIIVAKSSFAPQCFQAGHYLPHEQIKDPALLRLGYYGRIAGTIESNYSQVKPGMYINLGMIELVAQGKEIVRGPDAGSVFGQAGGAVLPAGAIPLPTYTPPASQPPGMGAVAGFAPLAATPMQMPVAAMPAALPTPAPAMAVQPNASFLAGPGVSQMPGVMAMPPAPAAMAMPPAPPAGPVMTAKAGAFTYAQMIAGGWTDADLRAQGYVA